MNPPEKFSVGLVQMALLGRSAGKPREGGGEGRRGGAGAARGSSACRSSSGRGTSASGRIAALFDLAEPVPGPTTEALAEAARRHGVVVIAPVFERRAPRPVPQQRGRDRCRRERSRGSTARCTSPTTRAYYEKFYFTPGDLGFPAFDTRCGPHRDAHLLGPVVSGRRRGSRRSRARAFSSIRRRSAGIRTRRPSTARRSATPGGRSSAATRSPTASTSPRSTASASRRRREAAPGIEFWGSSFVADPQGVVVAEASADREERFWSPRSTRSASRTCAATGRSCATGASTPTAGSPAGISTSRHVVREDVGRVAPGGRGVSACPPSGSRTRPPGSAGLTTGPTGPASSARSPGSTAEIVRKLAPGEFVRILVESKAHEAAARRVLARAGVDSARVEFFRFPTNRGWTRDSGPMFLRREGKRPDVAVRRFRLQRLGEVRRLEEGRRNAAEGRARSRPAAPAGALPGRRSCSKAGAIDVNGARHADHDRGVPARRKRCRSGTRA